MTWRAIALAGALSAAMAGTADGQTVVIRGIPAGSAAELVQGGTTVSARADAGGDAVLQGSLSAPGETRVTIFADICDDVRRVVLVARDAAAPPQAEGCTRTAAPGLFVVRPASTIVVTMTSPVPAVLLRQGPFDFRRTHRSGVETPEGLVVFGAAGRSWLHKAQDDACGEVPECLGENSGFGYGGGIGYWFTPYAGLEAAYLKPKPTRFEGDLGSSLFRSTFEPRVLLFVAKLGVPAGRARVYAQGGATWHRARISNIQDWLVETEIEDRFELSTSGWGWTYGGGIELWLAPAAGLYVEGTRSVLKGRGTETGGEGRLDERMTAFVAGLRISLNR
jgi:hypothetical protein